MGRVIFEFCHFRNLSISSSNYKMKKQASISSFFKPKNSKIDESRSSSISTKKKKNENSRKVLEEKENLNEKINKIKINSQNIIPIQSDEEEETVKVKKRRKIMIDSSDEEELPKQKKGRKTKSPVPSDDDTDDDDHVDQTANDNDGSDSGSDSGSDGGGSHVSSGSSKISD